MSAFGSDASVVIFFFLLPFFRDPAVDCRALALYDSRTGGPVIFKSLWGI